ncbi:MAG: radical SAM protein [Bacteroidales bacterium]|jgi:uncharacterized protein|nr:radical SAM protein [Bacteroidales bacterium]
MEFKASKYNIYLIEGNKFYIFNQLTNALSEFEEDLFYVIKNNEISEKKISNEEKDFLLSSNFLCDYELQEELIMLQRNRIRRYGNHHIRLTIMPTLNCNFRCWYCYEGHIASKMDSQTIDKIISFVNKLILSSKISLFELGWFGGEPLMYFEDVMYPIAKYIKKLCNKEKIRFRHSITTNGYLISDKTMERMNEIELNNFQITLDGSKEFHNKSRFAQDDKNTYDTIIKNITNLCRQISNVGITVRINYSPKNLPYISQIADSFPEDIRKNLRINPQIIWQYKEGVNEITSKVFEQLSIFAQKGYDVENIYMPSSRGIGCYTENMLQYVVNYDGLLYKCTARNFDNKYSIGYLNEDGEHVSNANYYNYFMSSFFENPSCLKCEVLPSCAGMCIQKKIENSLPFCPKESIYNSVIGQVRLIIQQRNT